VLGTRGRRNSVVGHGSENGYVRGSRLGKFFEGIGGGGIAGDGLRKAWEKSE